MNVLRQAVRQLISASLPRRRWLVRGNARAQHDRPALSLTFDDGPHPVHTERVLAALERWNLKGTFFVIGQRAAAEPQLIQRMLDAGHRLANHTWTHSEPAHTTASTFMQEVRETDRLISEFQPDQDHPDALRWMRPPKGELTPGKLYGLMTARYSVALWNIDPRDYRMTSSEEVRAWCQAWTPQNGDIVLLHDCHGWAAEIVDELGRAGHFERFESVDLDHWCSQGRPLAAGAPVSPLTAITPVCEPRS